MSKFKVGDKVRVVNQKCAYHGTVGEVTEIDRVAEGAGYDFKVDFEDDWMPYDAWELKLVETPEFTKGQKVIGIYCGEEIPGTYYEKVGTIHYILRDDYYGWDHEGHNNCWAVEDVKAVEEPEVVTEKYGFKVGDVVKVSWNKACTFKIIDFDKHGFVIITSRSDGSGGFVLEKHYPGQAAWGFSEWGLMDLTKVEADEPNEPEAPEVNTKQTAAPKAEPAFIVIPANDFEQYSHMTKEAAEAEAKEYAESDEIDYVVLQVGSKFAHVSQVVETPITL